ncbi:phenylalanine--tRNA ligase subunit beta [Campylobacter pinnipediorum]|uniref:phenylalanine--tRNA ligase subunit beta n=1 Tax=Campylobacter pinnipediorum TaxID=1965231 RepID=UPI00084D5DE5|nr:phenylalanine--tRNA ligase subunit beta [Campylobacter pinnipediorum]
MIISKNWLNEWVDLGSISADEILKTLNSIGLEVDGFQEIKIPENIVVGYVKSKEKHPDADKLNVCQVDVGNENLQIVCGAKNVEVGQFVPVALVGTTMPNGMKIKKAKLRGIESSGMICSSTELGLAKTNDGIMVLDESIGRLELGKQIADFPIFSDLIIDVDITANRGDCQSINGIARELCVALDLCCKENKSYEDPENLPGIGRIFSIHSDENLSSSFLFKAIEINDNINESLITRLRLGLIGSTKTNPIERLLEYATYSIGVLFRAYDYSKLSSNNKVTFDLKNGNFKESIISCNGSNIGVAGVFQDKNYKIDENTKIAIIQASYSTPSVISEFNGENKDTQKDDEVYRSSRGSEPNLNLGIDFLFKMFLNLKSIGLYAGTQQFFIRREATLINIAISDIHKMIGREIQKNDIVRILKKLGFEVVLNQELETINVKVPLFRQDIVNIHDVCEEIVRIIGIDNINSKPLIFSEENRLNDTYKRYKFALQLRKRAASVGFFESVHYVFDNSESLGKLGFKPCKIGISNPINNELNTLRPTLVNHLLSSCEKNIKNSKKSIKLFEYGVVFDENANQSSNFGFLASGLSKEPSIKNGAKVSEVDFFEFSSLVSSVIGKIQLVASTDKIYLSPYEQAKVYKNGIEIGYIGRVHLKIADEMDLPKTYVAEIYFDKMNNESIKAESYSKFPNVSRDLSLIVPDGMKFSEIKECIDSLSLKNLKDFLPVDIYKSDELKGSSSITIKFTFQDNEKTLEDEEINAIVDNILQALKGKLNIGIR